MQKITKLHYLIVRIVTIILISIAIFGLIKDRFDSKTLGNHLFILQKAFSLLFLSFLPNILRKFGFKVPILLLNLSLLSFTAAILFGEILGFYKTVKIWDSIIHFSNGGLVAIVGFSFITLLNAQDKNSKLNPLITVIFGFCFAMTVGAIWELIEWGADAVTGSNMQRFRDNFDSTIQFVGRRALYDTMKDFLLNTSGALLFSVLGYIDFRKNNYFDKWLIITKEVKEV